jgi:hypothetical protein
MAQIEYKIDLDSTGKTVITATIRRLDPGDEVAFVSSSPDAALQWINGSPFDGGADILALSASSAPREVTKPVDLTEPVAQCGNTDGAGNFIRWAQGAGFPNLDSTSPLFLGCVGACLHFALRVFQVA